MLTKWRVIRKIRRLVNLTIENARKEKKIRSSLEAEVSVFIKNVEEKRFITSVNINDICIVSDFKLIDNFDANNREKYLYRHSDAEESVIILLNKSINLKCMRCWKYLPEVSSKKNEGLCNRCKQVVTNM